MKKTSISNLIDLLAGPALRVRTGIWLYPMELVGQEENEAIRLGIVPRDARAPLLKEVEPGSRFLGLDLFRLLRVLDDIVQNEQDGSVVMIYNFDLLIAKFSISERERAWQEIFSSFPHRPKGILLPIPELASKLLLPGSLLDAWREAGRVAETL